jgi:hypothetical protein
MALSAAHNLRYGGDETDKFKPRQLMAISAAACSICSHKLLVLSLGPEQARIAQLLILFIALGICLQDFSDATSTTSQRAVRVGVAGYGRRGRALVDTIRSTEGLVLVWVWGTQEELAEGEAEHGSLGSRRLNNLHMFGSKGRVDVVVDAAEGAGGAVTTEHGELLLERADLVVTAAGCLADAGLRRRLRAAVRPGLPPPPLSSPLSSAR